MSTYNKFQIPILLILVSIVLQFSCKSYFKPVKVENNYDYYKKEGIPINPGRCFGKSGFRDVYTYTDEKVAVYMGDDFDILGLQYREFLVRPEKVKWIWTSPRFRDISKSPQSEYFWALSMPEAQIGQFYEVVDTNFVRDFEYEIIKVAKLEIKSHKKWVEVLCKSEMTDDLIINLKKALIDNGYGHELKINNKITEETYRALAYYQVNNELPIGNLDFETLKLLGVLE